MKVIDLLQRIANGEAPENIKYNDKDYYLYDKKSYLTIDKSRFFDSIYFKELNEEVEVIEEDKKIKRLDLDWVDVFKFKKQAQQDCAKMIFEKMNEIIDKINSMEEK